MEIGSEFWEFDGKLESDNTKFWNIGKDNKFTFSGRTSIYYVLKNILLKKNIQTVYFPSYSCISMIQAFEDLGINIEYYDVYYNEGLKYNIDIDQECDIFFAMNYFGYSSTNMEKYTKIFKQKGKIVIEDITHSIFSNKQYSEYSDYLVGSLRKWFPIASGGIAVNMNGKFEIDLNNNYNQEFFYIKKLAMENKKEYMNNIYTTQKESFLNQYSESNKILTQDYKDYQIDKESLNILFRIDLEDIKNKRIKNVKLIKEKLIKNPNIKFLVKEDFENDVLLFVPIILENRIRNELRKHLIDKQIYLPIHWPLEENINNIFNKEISLVCDQRYDVDEIEEYINLILNYLNNK